MYLVRKIWFSGLYGCYTVVAYSSLQLGLFEFLGVFGHD